ncbi:MAG: hypothetical protein ACKVQA_12510, partial [Burkholderiales bacterium]
MSNENVLQTFLRAADAWVCDSYAFDIRYLADVDGGNTKIWDASITLNPLPPQRDLSFRIDSARFVVGQVQRPSVRKSAMTSLLTRATIGEIAIGGRTAKLATDQPLDYYSEMTYRERWFSQLHLQVLGTVRPPPATIELAAIDNALRGSEPPFDGLTDAAAWLGLSAPGTTTNPPSIGIRVGPPVDLIFEGCRLEEDRLTLTLHAHPKFDVSRVGLAVRAVPSISLDGRRQIADKIKWSRVLEGRRVGNVQIKLDRADNVLAMLLIEDSTVRRQWFIDPAKARNNRLLAVQHFDKDLRMIKQAVLDSSDSAKFEHGVAALLFVLGFTPSVQLETDAPDLIVTTPGGKLAIVECTTRISDFAAKVGRLVDRRGALSKQLSASGHPAEVAAVLICRLPRDQIAAQA